MIVLITGPVRSGKSKRATQVSHELGSPVTHVVTARVDPADREMADRVARHRRDRGDVPVIDIWLPGSPDLTRIVRGAEAQTTLLVDSLGTWLAGYFLEIEELTERDPTAALDRLETICDPLVAQLAAARANIVLVAEETGWGLVPLTAQGRLFRDVLGRLTRRIGQFAERVELVVAGFALDLRRCGVPVLP
jgi:adenosylcobinamide kinase/adenosylcobinamide-phosphate guanylyltransferase